MGGGASSLFWSKEAKKLITIEDNQDWYTHLLDLKQDNQQIFFKSGEEYYLFPLALQEKFDVIVIDGSYRNKCAEISQSLIDFAMVGGAMIILDNSDWLYKTAKFLREQGFIEIKFHGFAPINPYTHTTSIFLTRNFNFALKNEKNNYSISPIYHVEDE